MKNEEFTMQHNSAALVARSSVTRNYKVVYFPSCINQTMGLAKKSPVEQPLVNKMVSLLQKAGYEVLTAMDEPGARSILKKNEINLVFGDVRLPEGNGISLLEWMMRSNVEVPFIVMTDYACITDAVRAIKLGAKDYLQKPVHQEQLIELVHSMLKQPVIVRKERSFVERTSEAARKSASLARRVAPSDLFCYDTWSEWKR